MKTLIATAAVVTALISAPAAAQTQASDIGRVEFEANCAVCHGMSGKGDGPAAPYVTPSPANLITISKHNKGVFPFVRVYEVIDGTREIKGHGTRAMPIWGKEFSKEGWRYMHGFGTAQAAESYVQGLIVALIGYIHGLQER